MLELLEIYNALLRVCGPELTITLTMDDGTKVPYTVLNCFPMEDKIYASMFPTYGPQKEPVICRVKLVDGDPNFEAIENEEEYKKAQEALHTNLMGKYQIPLD